jgi:Lon protease-like protein
MSAEGEAAAEDDLPPLPSVNSVEFYNEVLGDTESTSARTLGRVEEIGIFPLGMVLNPGAVIPLHIFEMRYRQLFNQAWEGSTKVGIVMFDKEKNLWSRVGTMCKVVEFQTQPDGRIITVNEGDQRFRVLKVTRSGSQMEYAKALVEFHDDFDSEDDLSGLEDKVSVWM